MNEPLLLSIALGFVVFYVLHVVVWRSFPSTSPRIFLISFLMAVGLLGAMLTYGFLWGWHGEAIFVLASFIIFIDACYLYFYSVICRAVSVTLLSQLNRVPGHRLPFSVIVRDYTASARFDDRIKVMQASGFIEMRGTAVTLTQRGLRMARAIKAISNIICGGIEG